MHGFVKAFGSLVTSSVWSEDSDTRVVWVTMMVTADVEGIVEGSVPGLARMANVPLPACQAALEKFLSPDPYSRSQEHEGRRIEAIPGGWRLLNHGAYRARAQTKDGSRAPYMRKRREDERARKAAALGQPPETTTDPEPDRTAKNDLGSGERPEVEAEQDAHASHEKVTCNNSHGKEAGFSALKVTRCTEDRRQKTENRNNGATTTAGARAREEPEPLGTERSGPLPANPLVDRDRLVREGSALIASISRHRDEDPTQTLARNSTGDGKLTHARRVRLDGLSDDHLAQTLCDLRDDWKRCADEIAAHEAAQMRPAWQPDPEADALVQRLAARLESSMGEHAWARWVRVLAGLELTGDVLRVVVPTEAWLTCFGVAYASQINEAMEGEGVAHLRLELVPQPQLERRAKKAGAA